MASNVDIWLTFFKGQLTLHEIMYEMSYKRLMELVEWNEGKPAAEPAEDSEPAEDQAVPSEFAGEENVLLASG